MRYVLRSVAGTLPSVGRSALGGIAIILAVAACGSSSASPSSSATHSSAGPSGAATTSGSPEAAATSSAAPPGLVSAGKLTYCSDMEYPPGISLQDGKPVGYDHDIGVAVAKQMGVTAEFLQIPFASIIGALNAKKCDAIINSVNVTAAREKVVDMVPYGGVGYTILVQKGNAHHVLTVKDLCGLSAGASLGEWYIPFLQSISAKCKQSGKPGIDVVTFESELDGIQSLAQGKVTVMLVGSPYAPTDVTHGGGQFEIGGQPNQKPIPIAIVLRKGAALRASVAKAVQTLYRDGSIPEIFTAWKLPSLKLSSSQIPSS